MPKFDHFHQRFPRTENGEAAFKWSGLRRALVEMLMLFSADFLPGLFIASPTAGISGWLWDVLLRGYSNRL